MPKTFRPNPDRIARKLGVIAGCLILLIREGHATRSAVEGVLEIQPTEFSALTRLKGAELELKTASLLKLRGRRQNRYELTELGEQVAAVLAEWEPPVEELETLSGEAS
jgi:hypothetical protein